MVSQKHVVITQDVFLLQAISFLMQEFFCENKTYFLDVDSFNTLSELNNTLYRISEGKENRTFLISRGLWLSQVISSEIDLSVNDALNIWRHHINVKKSMPVIDIIKKIEGIKDLKDMTAYEAKTIHSLRLSDNIYSAAIKSGVSYKSFLRQTNILVKRYNLKNTANLHFFVYRFNK